MTAERLGGRSVAEVVMDVGDEDLNLIVLDHRAFLLRMQRWMRLGPTREVFAAANTDLEMVRAELRTGVLLSQDRFLLEARVLVLEHLIQLIGAHRVVMQGLQASVVLMNMDTLNRQTEFQIYAGPQDSIMLRDISNEAPELQDVYHMMRVIYRNDGQRRLVREGIHVQSGRKIVVKEIPKHFEGASAADQQFLMHQTRSEFVIQNLLRPFGHSSVLLNERYFENAHRIYAVFQKAEESLYDYTMRIVADVDILVSICKQMASAIQFLAGLGVVHRDLKLENFVLTTLNDGSVRVQMIDFGMATTLRMREDSRAGEPATYYPEKAFVGTVNFMAPEIFERNNRNYDAILADVWSLGVCFFQIGVGLQPFCQPNILDAGFRRIFQRGARNLMEKFRPAKRGVVYESEELMRIIDAMLVVQPGRRISLDALCTRLDNL